MVNCAVIMGRLTADPELRTTQSGLSVTSFCVAVDRRYGKGDDKQTDFINVVAWRSTADFVTRWFKKGSMIAVQGPIQSRNYEDRNGNKRTAVEIVADNVSFCGSKSENNGANNAPAVATDDNSSEKGQGGYIGANLDDFTDLSNYEPNDEAADEGLPF